MLILYHGQTSVCSQKVRLVLAEKGLEWESRLIDLPKGEQFLPEYLALNPEGVVPTLIDDGKVIVESSVIAEYLDRLVPANPLMPVERGPEFDTRLWLLRTLAIHEAINTMTFATAGRDRALATQSPDQIESHLTWMPNPQMAAKRRDLYASGTASVFAAGALFTLDRMMADMATALARTPWLCGSAYGLADAAVLAYVDRLERLGLEGLWQRRHPGIARWLAAAQGRPSYAVAISAFINANAAAGMREAGGRHWPAIAALLS